MDISSEMLACAQERVNCATWKNVQLAQSDVVAYQFPEGVRAVLSTGGSAPLELAVEIFRSDTRGVKGENPEFMARQSRRRKRGRSILNRPLPDYLAPNLKLLFVGINPGLRSATAGHYYANPQNPFWRFLHEAGFTPVQLRPDEDARMIEFGYGLTDMVKRPSQGAADLRAQEFSSNRNRLRRIVRTYQPRAVCFNSKTAFEGCFGKGVFASFGPQQVTLEQTPVFVLPSTSPANAAIPLDVKRSYFKAVRNWLDTLG